MDEYEQRLFEQDGLCAVCRCVPKIVKGAERPLSVDHNHKSGANRGLLCDSCNLILGFAKDSQELLRRLIVYLQKHEGVNFDFVEDNPQTRPLVN
jgi:Recombination endonuclease VII